MIINIITISRDILGSLHVRTNSRNSTDDKMLRITAKVITSLLVIPGIIYILYGLGIKDLTDVFPPPGLMVLDFF